LTLDITHQAEHTRSPSDASAPEAEIRRRRPLWQRRIKRRVGRTVSALMGAIFPTPLGRALHRRLRASLQWNEVALDFAGAGELPTIAFLSDIHAGHFMTGDDLAEIGARVMERRPELVLLGGDLINHHFDEMRALAPLFEALSAPLGVFAVPGNHDYEEPELVEPWIRAVESHGIPVLFNRGVRLERGGRSLWLAGVDDLTEGRPSLRAAFAGRRSGEPTILLSHHPDVFERASRDGVTLQLSGHTHGGQFRFCGWAPLHHSRHGWVEGLHAQGDAHLFVGRGVGVTLFPLRIGTQGEVVILRPRA
jgi:predicted MPP superfamily phosphohydrolase